MRVDHWPAWWQLPSPDRLSFRSSLNRSHLSHACTRKHVSDSTRLNNILQLVNLCLTGIDGDAASGDGSVATASDGAASDGCAPRAPQAAAQTRQRPPSGSHGTAERSQKSTRSVRAPAVPAVALDNAVPIHLLEAAKHAFAPEGAFWREHGYPTPEFFSYVQNGPNDLFLLVLVRLDSHS